MNFKEFLEEKFIYIVLILFSAITSEILLIPFDIPSWIKVYSGLVPILMLFISIIIEYIKKKSFFNETRKNIEALDQKYLIAEVIKSPSFYEGKILKEILHDTDKSMLENVNKYKRLQEDYKEYIELWIHEIKLPISTGKLIAANNKSKVMQSIDEEFDKIENYVEQALFYARSNSVEKDYFIKKQELKEIINSSIIKNKNVLLQSKIKLDVHDLDEINVYTDSKWCVFIISQLLQNAIKYSKENEKLIEIYAINKKENITLCVKDNGIGIPTKDMKRVFEKGFTGENGRKNGQKATGIGLYLCKKLCDKLGLGISISSRLNIETELKIVFPKNTYIEEAVGD